MTERKKNEIGISTIEIILVLVIVALIGVIGFIVYTRMDKTTSATAAPTNSSASSKTGSETAEPTTINSIINKGDYQELAAYMSASVKVVKEGTDAGGTYYSATAAATTISDFYSKSNGAELPWDFTGDSDYKAMAAKSTGAVKAYSMQGNIAVSKNDWVLAYNLNSDQKISSFYMSPSVNLSK
jgi:hypothetical protein